MNYEIVSQSALFHGTTQAEIHSMLACLGATVKNYQKDEAVFHAGDRIRHMGIVLSGGIHIVQYSAWGTQTILDHVGPSHAFGEVYACIPQEPLLVSAMATQPTQVVFLAVERVLQPCCASCAFHGRLLRNLLGVLAEKNLAMTRKISHLSPRTIRERLLSYLSAESVRQGLRTFDLPFNRQQLADYLCVDRSALSATLSTLQREGLLSYQKNHMVLCGTPDALTGPFHSSSDSPK